VAAAPHWGFAARRRAAAMERRSGLAVSRVMAPPHERLSEAAARGMLASGFEAMTMSRPHPWLESGWLASPPGTGPLVGWEIAEQIAGGLPVLLRSALSHPREDLVLRAFLGQPLVLYGHAADLAGGADVLRSAAEQVDRLGPVRWTSLGDMVATSVETRVDGSRLVARMHARRVRIDVPDGVETVVAAHAAGGFPATTLTVERPGTVEVSLGAPVPRVSAAPRRPGAIRPIVRRVVSEARDRAAPLTARGVRAPKRPHPA
jgi:hypothetical protein